MKEQVTPNLFTSNSHNTWLFSTGGPSVLTQPLQDQSCVGVEEPWQQQNLSNLKMDRIQPAIPASSENQADFVCST